MSLRKRISIRVPFSGATYVLLAALVLAGCGRGQVGNTPATQTLQAAATNPPAPPPIGAAGTTCNQLPSMTNAGFIEIDYLDISESGVGTGTITSQSSAPLEVDEYNLCLPIQQAPDPDPAPVKTVLSAINVAGRNWGSSSVFPFDGTTPRPCTPQQACFSFGTGSQTYLLVESVQVHSGKLYTFHVRRAQPAPLVPCDPVLFPHDNYVPSISPWGAGQIPLPPITRISTGQGNGQGIITYLCTAGTLASITTYMNQALPKNGWMPVTVAGKQLWKTRGSSPRQYLQVYAVTNPRQWAILEYAYDLGV